MSDDKKIKVSEIFYSIQGEGRFTGVPSVFLRTFGCNFTCSGFGCKPGEVSQERLAIDPKQYKTYAEIPLVKTGCDSFGSWDPRAKHLSPFYDVASLSNKLVDLLPNNRWLQPNGNNIHLVITGGEPLLGWQRSYESLLSTESMWDLTQITFETNGTQEILPEFKEYLKRWSSHKLKEVTFSVSPKLSASGESWADAIRPKTVRSYEKIGTVYLKFVVETEAHFDEVDQAVAEYRAAGFRGMVYVMPVGGVNEVYDGNKFNVAEEALKRGYYYSPRLHIDLFGNSHGT